MATNPNLRPAAAAVPAPLLLEPKAAGELEQASVGWVSWDLTPRQLCDLELLLTGGFAPLQGFMGPADHARVCREMRLASGQVWPIPIVLDVTPACAQKLAVDQWLALRDPEGVMLAALQVEALYEPDRLAEAAAVYGTTDKAHPGVAALLGSDRSVYVGGRVRGIHLPRHFDFTELRRTPAQVRALFAQRGWQRVVAFQTRNPMHRAHVELTMRAAREIGGGLLVHPVVGLTKPGDVDHYTRVRGYRAIMHRFPAGTAALSLLPLAMRMAGPREAVWHAIVRRNHGCTHFIVGRDHAGPGTAPNGKPWYDPYAAQDLLRTHAAEVGIEMVPFREMVYVPREDTYRPIDEIPAGEPTLNLSGTQLRDRLARGDEIPAWFSYPEMVAELRATHPPRRQQGFTVFFTGLSGAGKSTIANVLLVKLLEAGGRRVTLLDGDHVRKWLSSELTFSRAHRDLNIHRIGFVAAETTRNGGAAICAPIAPFASARDDVRKMIEPVGGFVLVHVATPLEVCEQRDRKGLYAKARAGTIPNFTGVSDPYEAPQNADIVIDTTKMDAGQAAELILAHLQREGYLGDLGSPG